MRYLIPTLTLILTHHHAYACKDIGRGSAEDNKDCEIVLAQIFINEAQAPTLSEVSGKIFRKFDYWSDGTKNENRASFLDGEFWQYYHGKSNGRSEKELLAEVLKYQKDTSKPILLENNSVASPLTMPSAANYYMARKWGKYLVFAYGDQEKLVSGDPKAIQNTVSFCDAEADVVYNENLPEPEALQALLSGDPGRIEQGVGTYVIHPEWAQAAVLPLLDVVRSGAHRIGTRNKALNVLLTLNDPRVNQVALTLLDDSTTPPALGKSIVRRLKMAEMENRVGSILADGTGNPLFDAALFRAKVDRMKTAVLPLSDLILKPEVVRATLIEAMYTLGGIGSPRALPSLKNERLYNSNDEEVRTAARNAVELIDVEVNLGTIKTGNTAAFTWSKGIIQYHDGSKRELMFRILAEYKKVPIAFRPTVVKFLKSEIAAGYHDYDKALVEEMKAVLRAIR